MLLSVLVDFSLIAIVISFGYYGYKRGLIRSIAKFSKIIIVLLLAIMITPIFSEYITEPLICGSIRTQIKGFLLERFEGSHHESPADELPIIIKIAATIFNINLNAFGIDAEAAELLAEELSYPISHVISLPISFFCLIFIIKFLLKIALGATDILFKIPLIGISNRILGCALCSFVGIISAWLSSVAFGFIISLPIFGDFSLRWDSGLVYDFFNIRITDYEKG